MFNSVQKYGILEQVTLWKGLLSYYRLDETSGTVVYDAIGNVNGTVNNATINQTGVKNKAVLLDDDDENINLGNNYMFAYNAPFSFSLWHKRSVGIETGGIFFGKFKSTTPESELGYQSHMNGNGTVWMLLKNGASYIRMGTPPIITITGVWHHLVFTYNGNVNASGFEIYFDGVKQTHDANNNVGTLTTIANTTNFYIGNRNMGADLSAGGYIDEFAIWNRALREDEAKALYSQGNGKFY